METKKNISGISENLADSIIEQRAAAKKAVQPGWLDGKRIAISVSENEDLEYLGLSDSHLKDATIEVARYFMVCGATLLYGGDLRKNGYAALFSELSYQYRHLSDKQKKFVNYFPYPQSNMIKENEMIDLLKNQVDAVLLERPPRLRNLPSKEEYKPHSSIQDRYVIAECLSEMRLRMAKESEARILLGGMQDKYVGYFPGIIEEGYLSLKAGKAVYVLGGFGGAAKSLSEALCGYAAIKLSNEYQQRSASQREFSSFVFDNHNVNLNYDILVQYFNEFSIEKLSENNGLTCDENQILFQSTNIHELIFLMLKGMKRLKQFNE